MRNADCVKFWTIAQYWCEKPNHDRNPSPLVVMILTLTPDADPSLKSTPIPHLRSAFIFRIFPELSLELYYVCITDNHPAGNITGPMKLVTIHET